MSINSGCICFFSGGKQRICVSSRLEQWYTCNIHVWFSTALLAAIRSAAVQRINDTWVVIIGSAAQRIVARGFLLAALQIVVGGFLIRTAVKIVTRRAVFFPSLLEFILRAGLA